MVENHWILCSYLGGGFKYFLCSPLLGEMIQFDEYLANGLKPPTRYVCSYTVFLFGAISHQRGIAPQE